jgi:hypothetical protein
MIGKAVLGGVAKIATPGEIGHETAVTLGIVASINAAVIAIVLLNVAHAALPPRRHR